MYCPRILKKDNKEYILEKVYEKNRYALYFEWNMNIRECFSFHELGMIEEIEEQYGEARKGGSIRA